MKSWKVRLKGRVQGLLIYYAFVILVFLDFTSRHMHIQDEGYFTFFLSSFFLFFPVSIGLIVLPTYWVFKKKIPIEIIVDSNKEEVILKYNIELIEIYSFKEFAFSLTHHGLYSTMIFYKKVNWYHGRLIYRRITGILSPFISISWNRNKLIEIGEEFKKQKIDQHHSKYGKNILINLFE